LAKAARGKQQEAEEKKPFEHPENRGSAFTNDKASKDTDPDYMGTANIGGTLYRIVIWSNEFDGDKERLALLFETEEEYQEKKAAREAESGGGSKGKGGSTSRSGGNTRRVARNRNY
jgi:hypothetical protein